jgi:hypothetical protein
VQQAEMNEALVHLGQLPSFAGLDKRIDGRAEEFVAWFKSAEPENSIPVSLL